jgi:hypothetical protein
MPPQAATEQLRRGYTRSRYVSIANDLTAGWQFVGADVADRQPRRNVVLGIVPKTLVPSGLNAASECRTFAQRLLDRLHRHRFLLGQLITVYQPTQSASNSQKLIGKSLAVSGLLTRRTQEVAEGLSSPASDQVEHGFGGTSLSGLDVVNECA